MIGKQGLHFELLLVAALWMANARVVREAAIDHAEIGVFDGGIFEWPGAKFTAFFGTPAAEVLYAGGGVEPGSRRPIVGVAKDETFPRAIAWLRNQETGLADFASRGCGGVRKPNERDAEEAKIRVDERDGLIQTNARVRGVELPLGMLRVADGDPGFTNEVDIAGKAFHFAGLEVERILGQQEGGIGAALDLHGAVEIERRPNPTLLLSENPLYFEAREVERLPGDVYLVREAWITICDPEHPKWQFYTSHARIRLDKTVALVNANFRLFRVPLIWLPYATAPAGRKIRQSGFLIPEPGNSSRKGFIFGDAYYWAPAPWFDTTIGAQYLSRRGSEERGEFRARPFENTSVKYTYFGVIDRGLLDESGVRHPQGGHQQEFAMQSLLPDHWRFVADINELTSLTFRLAFADTYGDAINSEVRSATFVSNNFRGFSLNVADLA